MTDPSDNEQTSNALSGFHAPVEAWFRDAFPSPTRPQNLAWPVIRSGAHTLLLSPTGSGKTLAAFLAAIDRVLFDPVPPAGERCRVLYISPLKALAVDVEKNLQEPLLGITYTAEKLGVPVHQPTVAVRTGDTPSRERAQFQRRPADFLITTPESLFLMLTSQVRERLRSVQYVIIDEIHTMVSTKRGAHLALSLERLAEITNRPFQRIGLSATQRPLEEVAAFLGGYDSDGELRPVQIVDAGRGKKLDIRVVMPASELMPDPEPGVKANPSIWAGIHPMLLEQISAHRTTLIFVNSRRMAERLTTALNDLAGSEVVQAHHGSLSREQRLIIENDLKSGRLPALIATSSLELGIDMGSIDLVIQLEAAPSVSSALQRVGRAGHQVGETSVGILVPKFKGDLLACAALTKRMLNGEVEPMRYPRNPLDVLAQQVVAMVAVQDWTTAGLASAVRRSAPFHTLPDSLLETVLDMLSGLYPSDDFSGLRPRITWDRSANILSARQGAMRVVVANAGTIPDRGHYSVHLTGAADGKTRVGELDEELVFETKPGDVLLLGATGWRVDEITQDKVFVSPAPGRTGRIPFWHGDTAGRPAEFGRAIGALCRQVADLPPAHAIALLMGDYLLDEEAAKTLVQYLKEQKQAGGLPSDRTLVVESYRDEQNEWRVCLLSPYGARVHAPLAMAVAARVYENTGREADILWMDDGIVMRLPGAEHAPDPQVFFPDPEEVEDLIVRQLGVGGGGARAVQQGAPVNALFASRFREAAARALLLPRRAPGRRSPLWQQRKRAADLLHAASDYGSFPIVLETFREILQDDFDLGSLIGLLHQIRSREIEVVSVTHPAPSPFAASLFFFYIANFMYEGDAPIAERRAQALQIDGSQLRALLGTTELRALLDPDAIVEWESHLQHLTPERAARHPDGLHDLLLDLGDLTAEEIRQRIAVPEEAETWIAHLAQAVRIVPLHFAGPDGGETRYVAVEDAARYRDALALALPASVPQALSAAAPDALDGLVGRYARTHGPLTPQEVADRFATGIGPVLTALRALGTRGKVIEGEFRPEGVGWEWCDAAALRSIRRISLEHLRREVQPVSQDAFARLLLDWQSAVSDADRDILQIVEQLQGVELPASVLETQILPARFAEYDPDELDALFSSGEIVWVARRSRGANDGWIRLYLADSLSELLDPPEEAQSGDLHIAIREYLDRRGASFFPQMLAAIGGFPTALLDALWDLVWAGEVTNDSLHPLRALVKPPDPAKARRIAAARGHYGRAATHGRRATPPEAAGRWSLVRDLIAAAPSATVRATARVRQSLARTGIVTRETLQAEGFPGGFSAAYPVLRALEEAGRIRRGYFVEGLGALQFALPAALDRLRSLRDPSEHSTARFLSAADPANPYGLVLPWPGRSGARRPGRAVGARVALADGYAIAWFSADEKTLLTFLDALPEARRETMARLLAELLAHEVEDLRRRALLIESIDEANRALEPLHGALLAAGFVHRGDGYQKRIA